MKDFLTAYRILAATSLKSAMQYKFSFLANLVGVALYSVSDFVILATILLRFHTIGGWDIWEVALLYGVSNGAFGLFRVIGTEIHNFDEYLVNGQLDGLMTRPWDPLFVLLSRKLDINRVGAPLQALTIATIGAVHLVRAGTLSPASALLLPLLVGNGFLIYAGISVATSTIGFWTTRIDDLQVVTLYAPSTASGYPLSILPNWLRGIMHTALPIALTSYLPLSYLLHKGASWWAVPASFVGTAAFLVLVWRFWLFGIRRYNSTGS